MIEFKISDFLYPHKLVSTYLLLKRSEHWSKDQFRQYQATHLSRLLRFCAEEVPYYGPVFRDAGLDWRRISPATAFACLQALPLLSKDEVREHPEALMAQQAERFNPKPITTSGTTGTPLTVYWDRGSNVMELGCMQRFWRWAGFRVGQPFLDLRSRVFTDEDRNLVRDGDTSYIRNWKVNGLEFSSDFIDEQNIDHYYRLLCRYKPRLVRGHPQAIQHVVTLLEHKHLNAWRPMAVTPTSEALYDFQRQQIERVWRAPVLDHYGLKEHNVFLTECREGGYHIYPEYGICEILDDDGKPVSPGQEGWIVATGLHSYAQPLLRYNTRDRAIASDDQPCACGRTLPRIERLVGRIDDYVYTADGKRYSGMHFAFFGRSGIKKARLIQTDIDKVTVELVATPEFDQSEHEALLRGLEMKVEKNLVFEFQFVQDIVQDNPGKFKFVVSNIKSKA